jgi:hypothetical protein
MHESHILCVFSYDWYKIIWCRKIIFKNTYTTIQTQELYLWFFSVKKEVEKGLEENVRFAHILYKEISYLVIEMM